MKSFFNYPFNYYLTPHKFNMSVSKQLKEELKPLFNFISIKRKQNRKSNQFQASHICVSIEKYKGILRKSLFNADLRKKKSEKYRAKAKERKRQLRNPTRCATTQTLATSHLPKSKKSSFPEDLLRDFPFLESPTHDEEISELFNIFDLVLSKPVQT